MVHNHWPVGLRLQSVTCTTYAWCHRDGDHSRGLRRHQFAVKMKINPMDASIAALEKTWLDGLSIWKRITGNNEYERVSLQTYYLAIRDGLPDKPFEAPLVRLRQWLRRLR